MKAGFGVSISNGAGKITISRNPIITQIKGSNELTTSSTTDESLSTPMVITPGEGDYLVFFHSVVSNNKSGKGVIMTIYVNGSKISETAMQATSANSNDKNSISGNTYITDLEAGQTIEIKWRAESNTAFVTNRSLIVQRVK